MNISIIGATSFLASAIIKRANLSECSITGYDRKKTPLYNFPNHGIAQLDTDALAGQDLIIYCAGGGIQPNHGHNDDLIEGLNYDEPRKLIEVLNGANFRGQLITFGSYFEIGDSSDTLAYNEAQLINANNPLPNVYCQSKKQLTSFAHDNLSQNSFDHLHLVLTNIYGVGENEERLIPYLAKSFKSENSVSLTSGLQIRQYTHVDDVAKFILDKSTRKLSGILNFTDPKEVSVKELVMQMAELMKFPLSKLKFGAIDRRDISMAHLSLDCKKLQLIQPNFKFKPLIEGLNEYI